MCRKGIAPAILETQWKLGPHWAFSYQRTPMETNL